MFMAHATFASDKLGAAVALGLVRVAAATASFACCRIAATSGPNRYAAASSGMVATGASSGAFILRTAVIPIRVDANAAAIEGMIIKYFSKLLTSASVTSATAFPVTMLV